jgi:nucleoid DNA-binding protein
MEIFKKSDLIVDVAKRTNCVQAVVKEIIEAQHDAIEDAILAGMGVKIGPMGTLSAKVYPAYSMNSGLLGKVVDIPERRVVKFVQSPTMKNTLKELSK